LIGKVTEVSPPEVGCDLRGFLSLPSACFSCHDSATAQTHMANDGGGSIYGTRAAALGKSERCLDCHGVGKASPIKTKHKQ
jgi:formate-dependent nitrite reductase cytochrome c552 subunit